MVREVCKDIDVLQEPSRPAVKKDLRLVKDMIDTLNAHEECLGLAADIIGENVCILVVRRGNDPLVMCNPKILDGKELVETQEGCLSHSGFKKANRFMSIEVEYRDKNWKKQKKIFTSMQAGVIQHEMDHMKGILI